MQIYLARNNQQAGPYSLEQINQMLASQQVLLTDLAWHQGLAEWKALGELTQGQLSYQPTGYTPTTTSTNTENLVHASPSVTQKVVEKTQLASIASRALAKIIDLLLWIPAIVILTAFFSLEQQTQFISLNEQFLQVMRSEIIDANLAQQLQNQMLQLIPLQAWIASGIYLLSMLAIQAFLLSKTGQSIGKRLTKIKIVDQESNQTVSLMRVFTIRSVFFIVLNIINLMLGLIISLVDYVFAFSPKRQTLHDKLAKTKVIKQ